MSFLSKDSNFFVSSNTNSSTNNQELLNNEISLYCSGCKDPINSFSDGPDQQIVNANGETYHSSCFVYD